MENLTKTALEMIGCNEGTGDHIGGTKVANIEGGVADLMRLYALKHDQKKSFLNVLSGWLGQYLPIGFLERLLFPQRFVTPDEFQAVFRESIPQGVTYSPQELQRLAAKYPIYSLANLKHETQRRQFIMTFQNSDEGYFEFMKKKSPALFDFFFSLA